MYNYNTNNSFFVLVCDEEDNELKNIKKFLHLLNESSVGTIINNYVKDNSKGGRPQYNPHNMLATILYGFAFSSGSLRDIQEKCIYDTRFMYISNNIRPSYVSISNFINDVIIPNIDLIFALITKAIFKDHIPTIIRSLIYIVIIYTICKLIRLIFKVQTPPTFATTFPKVSVLIIKG